MLSLSSQEEMREAKDNFRIEGVAGVGIGVRARTRARAKRPRQHSCSSRSSSSTAAMRTVCSCPRSRRCCRRSPLLDSPASSTRRVRLVP